MIDLLQVVKTFIAQLEVFANSLPSGSPKSFRFKSVLEMKVQVTEFIRSFHQKKTETVNVALDREKWKIASEEKVKRLWPTSDVKMIVEKRSRTELDDSLILNDELKENNNHNCEVSSNGVKTPSELDVINGHEEVVLTAEVFYVLLEAVAEYCHLLTVTGAAEVILSVVELLRVANARIAHLILGAGAVELKVCKSITVGILVIVFRGKSKILSSNTKILKTSSIRFTRLVFLGLNLIAESIIQTKDLFEKYLVSAKSQHVVRSFLLYLVED